LLKFTTTVSVALVLAARLAITRLTVWPFTLTVPVLATGVPTRFAPTGSASVTVTFAAALGPAFATTITKLVVAVPAYTVVLPATLLIVSDAWSVTLIVAVAVLFARFRSAVVAVIADVPVTLLTGTVNVIVLVCVSLGASCVNV
jgi:hypothetical protein